MFVVPHIPPGDRQLDLLIAGGHPHLVRQAANRLCRDMGDALRPLRRVLFDTLFQKLKRWRYPGAVIQGIFTQDDRVCPRGVRADGADFTIPPELVLGIEATLLHMHLEAVKQTKVITLGIIDHQFGGIAVLNQELTIEQPLLDDFMADCQQQRTIGAGFDRHPLIGYGRVSRADGIDGDKASAVAFEFGDVDLERIGVVIFCCAQHNKQLGAIQIGAAELPE